MTPLDQTAPTLRKDPNPTLKHIAEATEVSIWAVSSILNNRHVERRISPQTVEKVLKVASEMGYLPNVGARQLRRKGGRERTLVIAIMTSREAPLSLTTHLIHCLQHMTLSEEMGSPVHVSLTIELYAAGRLSEVRDLLTSDRFNAAIITNTVKEDDEFLAANRLPYPVVIVNRVIDGYHCVLETDDLGDRAAEVLIDAGCRRPALVRPNLAMQSMERRSAGYARVFESRLGIRPETIVADGFTEMDAWRAMTRFLESGGQLDGLFCLTDGFAPGACHALKTAGLSIPGDVSVIGIGDNEAGAFFSPPLSTVGAPPARLGEGVSLLLGSQLSQRTPAPRVIEVPITVQPRSSTDRRTTAA